MVVVNRFNSIQFIAFFLATITLGMPSAEAQKSSASLETVVTGGAASSPSHVRLTGGTGTIDVNRQPSSAKIEIANTLGFQMLTSKGVENVTVSFQGTSPVLPCVSAGCRYGVESTISYGLSNVKLDGTTLTFQAGTLHIILDRAGNQVAHLQLRLSGNLIIAVAYRLSPKLPSTLTFLPSASIPFFKARTEF